MDYGRILLDDFVETPIGKTVKMRVDPQSKKLFGKLSDGEEYNLSGDSSSESIAYVRESQPPANDSTYVNIRIDPVSRKMYAKDNLGNEFELVSDYKYENVLFVHSDASSDISEKGYMNRAYKNIYDAYNDYNEGDIIVLMNDTVITNGIPLAITKSTNIIACDGIKIICSNNSPSFVGGIEYKYLRIDGGADFIADTFSSSNPIFIIEGNLIINCNNVNCNSFVMMTGFNNFANIKCSGDIECAFSGSFSAISGDISSCRISISCNNIIINTFGDGNLVDSSIAIRCAFLDINSKDFKVNLSRSLFSDNPIINVTFDLIINSNFILNVTGRCVFGPISGAGFINMIYINKVTFPIVYGSNEIMIARNINIVRIGSIYLEGTSGYKDGSILFSRCGRGNNNSIIVNDIISNGGTSNNNLKVFYLCDNIIVGNVKLSNATLFHACSNMIVNGNITIGNSSVLPRSIVYYSEFISGENNAKTGMIINGKVIANSLVKTNISGGATLSSVIVNGEMILSGVLGDVSDISINNDLTCAGIYRCGGLKISENSRIHITGSIPDGGYIFDLISSSHVSVRNSRSYIRGTLTIQNPNVNSHIFGSISNSVIEGFSYNPSNKLNIPSFIKTLGSNVDLSNGNIISLKNENNSFIESLSFGSEGLYLTGKSRILTDSGSDDLIDDIEKINQIGSGVLIFSDREIRRSYYIQDNSKFINSILEYQFSTQEGFEDALYIPKELLELDECMSIQIVVNGVITASSQMETGNYGLNIIKGSIYNSDSMGLSYKIDIDNYEEFGDDILSYSISDDSDFIILQFNVQESSGNTCIGKASVYMLNKFTYAIS